MKCLVITVGIPGSGKTTTIENAGLSKYSISSDSLRLMVAGSMYENGREYISSVADKFIWKDLIVSILEKRFQLGLFTIFDSTGLSDINFIKNLSQKYGYRIIYVVFDHLSLESCYANNCQRNINNLPKEVLKKFYSRFEKWELKNSEDIIHTKEFETPELALLSAYNYGNLYLQDFSNYDSIYICPDVHGMFDVVEEFFNKVEESDKGNKLYIFLGDYIDRGSKNLQMIKWLISNIDRPNFIFLLGNHDENLFAWAHNTHIINRSDGQYAYLETETSIKKKLRRIYKKFKSYVYFVYKGEKYFINHSGIDSFFPERFNIPSAYLTGVITQGYREFDSAYDSYIEVGKNWAKFENNPEGVVQIFGHRNVRSYLLEDGIKINDKAYCLESVVEYGYPLNVLKISNNGIEKLTFENNMDVSENLLSVMVKTKDFPTLGIRSLNFDRKAFYNNVWDKITMKARGLYRYLDNNTIAGRSYDKFFNLNEQKTSTLEYIKNNWNFPVNAYIKYDGYLVIVFYNRYTGALQVVTKSMAESDMVQDAYNILTDDQKEYLLDKCKNDNVSFIFECLCKNDDTHPIPFFGGDRLVLLNVIENKETFVVKYYSDLDKYFIQKKLFKTFYNFEGLQNFIQDYLYNIDEIEEGLVLEDSDFNKVKIKTLWFRIIKAVMNYFENGTLPVDIVFRKLIEKILELNLNDVRSITKEMLQKILKEVGYEGENIIL